MNEPTFRPITKEDVPFLQQLYGSTRESELNQTTWSAAEKHSFIEMQFNAQHRHYQEHFGNARFDLILKDGEPIGRLYVNRRPDEIRVIDIALMPELRGHGIGSRLMEQLIDEATDR